MREFGLRSLFEIHIFTKWRIRPPSQRGSIESMSPNTLSRKRCECHTFVSRSVRGLTATILLSTLVACSPGPDGVISAPSASSVTETIASIETTLDGIAAITVVGVIDHEANAEGVGLEQAPNQVIFFGNPALGTPLMQQKSTSWSRLAAKNARL